MDFEVPMTPMFALFCIHFLNSKVLYYCPEKAFPVKKLLSGLAKPEAGFSLGKDRASRHPRGFIQAL